MTLHKCKLLPYQPQLSWRNFRAIDHYLHKFTFPACRPLFLSLSPKPWWRQFDQARPCLHQPAWKFAYTLGEFLAHWPLFEPIFLEQVGILNILRVTWNRTTKLFSLSCILDDIIIDSHHDSSCNPANKDTRMLQHTVCSSLEISSMRHFLRLSHNHIFKSDMTILNNS